MGIETALIAGNLVPALMQARGESIQGKYAQYALNANARAAEDQASDAIARGEQEAGLALQQARQLTGSQKVAYAAQGLALDKGTPAEVVADTAAAGAEDAMTRRINAAREAFGYRSQAIDYRTQGRLARIAGRSRASGSIISGGLGAMRDYLSTRYKQGGRKGDIEPSWTEM